jgi:hypothetical protein
MEACFYHGLKWLEAAVCIADPLPCLFCSYSWKNRMIQCRRCFQWFHKFCVPAVEGKEVLLCDRWYLFVCGVCNGGFSEFLLQLEIRLPDALYLILWQLGNEPETKERKALGYSVETDIVPSLEKHLGDLCLEPKVGSTPYRLRRGRFRHWAMDVNLVNFSGPPIPCHF